MKILDLDMDYFMEKVAHTPLKNSKRLDDEYYVKSVWTEKRVRDFLENNLGLSKENKIKGRIVKGHDEALYFWEELIKNGQLVDPFEVVHVDSHADLGLGCFSDGFIQEKLIMMPVEKRRKTRTYEFNGKIEKINIGDYLLWAIAYRMISRLTYCANPNDDKNDYCWDIMKDFHEELIFDKKVTNIIQLKCNSKMEMPYYNSEDSYKKKYLEGAIKEPEVEFIIIPTIEDVSYEGDFDFAVFAQSPNYTPVNADYIKDIFREYIIEI
ncbi:MAG: UPF0489 family protein [Butyrivibrio sp.]|nr:UPF0489 family protein [Butyrivibrio sp.]